MSIYFVWRWWYGADGIQAASPPPRSRRLRPGVPSRPGTRTRCRRPGRLQWWPGGDRFGIDTGGLRDGFGRMGRGSEVFCGSGGPEASIRPAGWRRGACGRGQRGRIGGGRRNWLTRRGHRHGAGGCRCRPAARGSEAGRSCRAACGAGRRGCGPCGSVSDDFHGDGVGERHPCGDGTAGCGERQADRGSGEGAR